MKNTHFIYLLLSTSKNQARALLETTDKSQVQTVIKLLINLDKNISLLTSNTKSFLKHNKALFTKIYKNRMRDKKNYSLITRNWLNIYKILQSAKSILFKVLK